MRTSTRLIAVAALAAVLSLAGVGAATADGLGDADGNNGTSVTWNSNDGNVTFFDDGSSFQGAAQFPSEGPVGYRGSLRD
ncbi:hypothetical protein ABZY02_33010 [Streptomyces sp. NPDC006649]|uniref:hypothetical protein n=1 Tax=Streptomyces sp. NPDC006649 TaxID=3156896 RepID=UPI0033B14BFC